MPFLVTTEKKAGERCKKGDKDSCISGTKCDPVSSTCSKSVTVGVGNVCVQNSRHCHCIKSVTVGVGNVCVQTCRHCHCSQSLWVLAMSVYKPADIVIAVSQSLWVLAMSVHKPVNIVIALSQSLWVLAMYVYKPVDIVMAVSQSLWLLAKCVYKAGDIVTAVSKSLWVLAMCVCWHAAVVIHAWCCVGCVQVPGVSSSILRAYCLKLKDNQVLIHNVKDLVGAAADPVFELLVQLFLVLCLSASAL